MNVYEAVRSVEFKIHGFRGSEYLLKVLKKYKEDYTLLNKPVVVYFDPDVDGLVSGLFVCNLLDSIGIEYKWFINSNRSHDFSIPINKVKGMNIIAVDFLISEGDIKKIVDSGANIYSMDHHDNGDKFIKYTNDEGNFGIVVNNQYAFEPEEARYLSGAGVVFETIVNSIPKYNTATNRALVGLTLLSDVRNIEQNELPRKYLEELYSHPYKGYIRYLIDSTMGKDYSFGVPKMDRNFVDFKFSPVINSNLRFGMEKSVVRFFLQTGNIDISYQKKQKELVTRLLENITMFDFSHLTVVCIDKTEYEGTEYYDILSNFVGLVASRLLDKGKSVIAYLWNGANVERASFRGKVNGISYKQEISKVVHCEGHESGFGILELIPKGKIFKEINNIIGELEEGYKEDETRVIEVTHMGIFSRNKGKKVGYENMFLLSNHMKVIKYKGGKVVTAREGAKYKEYLVDGVSVMCFDVNLEVKDGYIVPMLDRGNLVYTLRENM